VNGSLFARFATRAYDPDAEKAALEASYCDPQVREPFIAALALASQLASSA
jgi:hypothetical protein